MTSALELDDVDLGAVAEQLWRRGWKVFPLPPRSKRATLRGWPTAAAMADLPRVRGWWARTPTANVAVVCGSVSGVWVLDVDGAAGHAHLAALVEAHGPLPATFTVRRASNLHLYFRVPQGTRIGRSIRIKAVRPPHLSGEAGGLDVLGDGGYVVGPHSMHPDGMRYLPSPCTEVAEPPSWLVDVITRETAADVASAARGNGGGEGTSVPAGAPPRRLRAVDDTEGAALASSALRTAPQRLQSAAAGTGNTTLNREAHGLAACRVDRQAAWDALWPVWEARKGGQGVGSAEALREFKATFESGWRAGSATLRVPRATGPRTRGPRGAGARAPRLSPAPASTAAAVLEEARGVVDDAGDDAEGSNAGERGSNAPQPGPATARAETPARVEPIEARRGRDPRSFLSRVLRTKDGDPKTSSWNVALLLLGHAPGVLQYDLHREDVIVLREPPWSIGSRARARTYPRPLEQADVLAAGIWLQDQTGVGFRAANVSEGLEAAAREDTVDTWGDWLRGLRWDGVDRLPDWLSDFMGARKTAWTQAVGCRWLMAAAARALRPGAKADNVLVFESKQGKRKSSALRALTTGALQAGGPTSIWFSDMPIDVTHKDTIETMCGVVIWEMGELSGVKKADVDALKAFITRQEDHFRRPFALRPIHVPRRTLFAASTNDDTYLADPTGARRWWPVRVHEVVNVDGLLAVREQLWAEAVARVERGERWWLDGELDEDRELVETQARITERRRITHPWESVLAAKLDRWQEPLSIAQVLEKCLDIPPGRQTRADAMQAASVLRHQLGWTKRRERDSGDISRLWYPPDYQWQLNIGGDDDE